jgi:hypothetical protein
MWRSEMSEARSNDCEGREQRTEEASRQKQEQRVAGLVAMLVVMLVGSSSHGRGGLIRPGSVIQDYQSADLDPEEIFVDSQYCCIPALPSVRHKVSQKDVVYLG